MDFKTRFSNVAKKVTEYTGSWWSCLLATILIIAWMVGGIVVGFTENYQMPINTGTSIVTFIMVFFIQHTQNRESKATQIKLDELILKIKHADNCLINIETLGEEELTLLQDRYKSLAERAREREKTSCGDSTNACPTPTSKTDTK